MFSQRDKERYVVMDDYKGKDKDQLTVKKGEFVYLVSSKKHDKNWMYVCNTAADKLGLVPAKILCKESETNNNIGSNGKSEITTKISHKCIT